MKLVNQSLQSGFSNPEYIKDQLKCINALKDPVELHISSAYLRSTGVRALSDASDLSPFKKKKAFIGVNNQSTSAQGIRALIELGFETYLVNTNRRDCIFHLKSIVSVGEHNAILLTGSANLTGQGLTKNFEHQVALEFDLSLESDAEEVSKVLNYLAELPVEYSENVLLASDELIDDMLVSGQLENEEVSYSSETKGLDGVERKEGHRIKIPRPKRPKSKAGDAVDIEDAVEAPVLHSALGSGVLVWRKNKLSKSDAQISGTKSTNVKGYMTMGNKSYRSDRHGRPVDNKTYMRQDIFGDLVWEDNDEFERTEAFANFEFWLDGAHKSTKRLLITDKPSREPSEHGLEDQKQPTTALHVCGFGKDFQDVLGKNLELYKIDTDTYRVEVN